jgi:hypothetical protein
MVVASVMAVVLERCAAVAGDLHLFADGSWFLVRIASTRSWYFWIGDWRTQWFQSRAFTILGEQTPAVLAANLLHSLHAVSVIFGLTLYAHALIALAICYRLAPKRWYILFPLMSLYAGSMNAEALAISDSHFVLSLYWPALFILMFQKELTVGIVVLLAAVSIPMVLSYETMLFWGVILAAICLWRARSSKPRALLVAFAGWYLLCSGVAFWSWLHPFDPTNKSGFVKGLQGLWSSDHLGAKTSIVVLLCCAVLLATSRGVRRIQTAIVAIAGAAVLFFVLQVILGRAPLTLNSQMQARVMNLVAPLVATGLLMLVWLGILKPGVRAVDLMGAIVALLGFGQVLFALGCVATWQGTVAILRYELLLHNGPIPYSSSVMSRPQLGRLHLSDDHATWPLLPLSLYASDRGDVKSIILPPPHTYYPFDPLAPATFPNLVRYGIHYDQYEAAQASSWRYDLGQTLTFTQGGSATKFETGKWSDPEAWATWSEGQEFGLKIPLHDHDLPDAVMLEAQIVPNLSETHAHSSAEVLVNGVSIGTWQFNYIPEFKIRTMNASVPRSVVEKQNPLEIRFQMLEPVLSPTEMGKGNDPRKLGLAFLKLGLYKAQ